MAKFQIIKGEYVCRYLSLYCIAYGKMTPDPEKARDFGTIAEAEDFIVSTYNTTCYCHVVSRNDLDTPLETRSFMGPYPTKHDILKNPPVNIRPPKFQIG